MNEHIGSEHGGAAAVTEEEAEPGGDPAQQADMEELIIVEGGDSAQPQSDGDHKVRRQCEAGFTLRLLCSCVSFG